LFNCRKYSFDAIVKPYDQTDIIVKESQLKKIIISYGEETIELDSNGKVVNLQLSSDGEEVVYVTGKNNLMIYNVITRKSSLILKLEKLNIFLKIINVCNSNVIMCEQNDNDILVSIKFLIQLPYNYKYSKYFKY